MTARVTWTLENSFLTYAQVDYEGDFVSELQALFDVLGAEHHIVAHELHKDGGSHYHCLVRFLKHTVRDPRHFDCHGFHPNYKGVRKGPNLKRVLDYVTKDGQYWGELDEWEKHFGVRSKEEIWDTIVECTTRDDFFATGVFQYISLPLRGPNLCLTLPNLT